jgi:hypothetical protein
MASPIFWAFLRVSSFMPITSPFILSKGPPEFPGLMAGGMLLRYDENNDQANSFFASLINYYST